MTWSFKTRNGYGCRFLWSCLFTYVAVVLENGYACVWPCALCTVMCVRECGHLAYACYAVTLIGGVRRVCLHVYGYAWVCTCAGLCVCCVCFCIRGLCCVPCACLRLCKTDALHTYRTHISGACCAVSPSLPPSSCVWEDTAELESQLKADKAKAAELAGSGTRPYAGLRLSE